eukprot:3264252-Amphidinium_carterae.1
MQGKGLTNEASLRYVNNTKQYHTASQRGVMWETSGHLSKTTIHRSKSSKDVQLVQKIMHCFQHPRSYVPLQ